MLLHSRVVQSKDQLRDKHHLATSPIFLNSPAFKNPISDFRDSGKKSKIIEDQWSEEEEESWFLCALQKERRILACKRSRCSGPHRWDFLQKFEDWRRRVLGEEGSRFWGSRSHWLLIFVGVLIVTGIQPLLEKKHRCFSSPDYKNLAGEVTKKSAVCLTGAVGRDQSGITDALRITGEEAPPALLPWKEKPLPLHAVSRSRPHNLPPEFWVSVAEQNSEEEPIFFLFLFWVQPRVESNPGQT